MSALLVVKSEMEAGINSVLNGSQKAFEGNCIPPAWVADYMETLGWEKGDLETNGWDYDWWLTFTKGNESFRAFGSGYYGTFEFGEDED